MKRYVHFLLGSLVILLTGNASAQGPIENAVWIDVRSSTEFSDGHVEGAHHIPHDSIVEGVTQLQLDYDTTIYLYCRSGGRAEKARQALMDAGYSSVANLGSLASARSLAALPPAQSPD